VLNMTLEVEPGEACKKELLKGLEGCPQLEQVEIVANPSLQFFMEVSNLADRSSSHLFFPRANTDIPFLPPGPKPQIQRRRKDLPFSRRHGRPHKEVRQIVGSTSKRPPHYQLRHSSLGA
jgi:hypothetical protein